jgi:preprotein translocase subunit SecF
MFLLHFLPDAFLSWVVNGLLVIGVVGTAASWIARYVPFVSQYRIPVQIIGIICLVLGVYFKGGQATELQWRERVSEQQKKIAIAEAQSQEANKQLQNEIKKTQKLTQEVKNATKAGIKANAAKMDSQCTVDSIAIGLHNGASLNQVPRGTRGTVEVLSSPGTSRPVKSEVK